MTRLLLWYCFFPPHWFRYAVHTVALFLYSCNFYDQMLQCILPAECRCRHFICKGEILFGGNQTDTVTAKEKHTHTRSSDMHSDCSSIITRHPLNIQTYPNLQFFQESACTLSSEAIFFVQVPYFLCQFSDISTKFVVSTEKS